MALKESDLIAKLVAELQAQLLNNPVPPATPEEGLQRLANAIGKAAIEYLTANAEVHVKVAGVGDCQGTLQ